MFSYVLRVPVNFVKMVRHFLYILATRIPTIVLDGGGGIFYSYFFSPPACGEKWDLDELFNININTHVTEGFVKNRKTRIVIPIRCPHGGCFTG